MPPLSVGDAVRCFSGSSEQVGQAALFYLWRPCRVLEIDDAAAAAGGSRRVKVRFDVHSGLPDEWIDVGSNRLQTDGKRSSVTLGSPPFPALKEKEADSAAPSVSEAVNLAAAAASSELPGGSLILDDFIANLQAQPQLSSSASSNSASPISAQAAAIIAGQGVDTSFFGAASAPSSASAFVSTSASASSSPLQQRSRPPPLPANIPPVRSPALYKSASSSGVVSPSSSPLPVGAVSSPPPPPPAASEMRSVSASFSSPPPPPAPPASDAPPAWSAGQSAPLSFERYAEQHRLDPDAYQIYTQRWQAAQQAHAQPNGKLSPPSALALNSSHPPPVSLPVSTVPASTSSSRKSSIDAAPPPPAQVSSLPTPAPPPPPPPPEPLSDFARELSRGSLVDVWSRRARSWQCGEVVEVTNSSSGSMVNVIDYSTHTREWMRRASPRLAAPFTKSVEQGASPPPSPKQQQAASSRKPQAAAAEQQPAAGGGMQKVTAALSSLSSAAASLLPSAVTSPKASSNGDRSFSSPAAASPRATVQKTAAAPHPPASQSPSPSTAAGASVAAPPTAAAAAASPTATVAAAPPATQSAPPAPAAGQAWSRTLTVGSVLDAYDTEQVWRVAEVLRDAGPELLIHYRGWASKWDEFIPRDSRRLAPLRAHSVGDTGPRKQPQLQQPAVEQQLPVAYPVNAYAASSAASSSRSSSRYDCRSDCKWKRVLSMGLGHREIQSLDSLFAVCCQLQDEYADHLLSGSQTQQSFSSFRHKLSRLNAEIERQSKQLPASAAFYLHQAADIARTIECGVVEQEETLRRQLLAEQEEAFMRRLNRHFLLSTVPADGDCLFAAVGKGFAKRIELMQAAQREEEERAGERERQQQPPLALPAPAATDDADSASTVIKQEEVRGLPASPVVTTPAPAEPAATGLPLPSQVPAVYRAKAVQTLLSSPSFHPLIRREVREALVQEREGRGDSTSKAIVAELKQRCGGTQAELEAAVDSPAALEVYGGVMGRAGIYGTQLEVEALSAALHVPIHAYYRAGQEDDAEQDSRGGAGGAEELRPTQIIGEGEKPPAIALAFYLGNRHYNLLLPRPPPPPPAQPQPVLPQPAAITASTSAAKPPLHPSAASEHRLGTADDELMIALLENSTPSPLPPVPAAGGAADGQLSMRRSVSGGSLTTSQSASEPVAAGSGGLHRRERSKDELHLLTQSSASSPRVRTMVKWESGAPVPLLPSTVKEAISLSSVRQPPLDHPAAQRRGSAVTAASQPVPAAQRSSSLPFSSSSSSSLPAASDMQLTLSLPHSAPRPVVIPRDAPLHSVLPDFSVVAPSIIIRQRDQAVVNPDLSAELAGLEDGETLLLQPPEDEHSKRPSQQVNSAQTDEDDEVRHVLQAVVELTISAASSQPPASEAV